MDITMKKIRGTVKLTDLKKGCKGIVKEIRSDREKNRKLLILGVLPGEEITLVQKYPVLLLKLGYSFVAIDENLGKNIKVIPLNNSPYHEKE